MLTKLKLLFFVAYTAFSVSIIIVLMFLFNKKHRYFRKTWSDIEVKVLGMDIHIQGEINEDADMMIMNHQSLVDIILLEHLHPKDPAWVAKREISNLFWFGNILNLPKMIIIERESKASLMKLLSDVKDRHTKGRTIMIFPEGTRSNGDKIRKFKAGARVVAEKHDFKVQPVIITGTNRFLSQNEEIFSRKGKVQVVFMPTVQAKKGTTWYDDIQKDMREVLQKNLKNA